ncbi:PE family protein [Mycobacterium haemophilum]|uniref:PE family protein n=1 Tax=Mycobacterium haemophilum TaxID=29311 RepID=A0A0I9Z115_9MYCO|nr:PE family protein [Mycobacterium haemophilum]AKN16904.1 PE family protein [Mycobacterium haemophilum DSM 44634]KLO26426.1 PE family protein [Mycobacterium haemophilum]KLO34646.1 PE family protein [Mycobacterium haemophilum]KLO39611.1 PE family protein [Mycobacterium haemophilum]KLO46542.1 PE family protein [Mycobacterium haemophilum]
MSFVNVDPYGMLAAAATLESLGSHMEVSNAAVASVITKIPPPAADYASKQLSLFFSGHGQQYQVQAARGTAFHRKLVRTLANGSLAYEEVESRNNESF